MEKKEEKPLTEEEQVIIDAIETLKKRNFRKALELRDDIIFQKEILDKYHEILAKDETCSKESATVLATMPYWLPVIR